MAHFRHFRAGYSHEARASQTPAVLAVIILTMLVMAFFLANKGGVAISAEPIATHAVR